MCPLKCEGLNGRERILISSGDCFLKYVHKILDAKQVAVLVVAFNPFAHVIDLDVWRQLSGLAKIDHPDAGHAGVVHEQE